ncbi:hypothetical protein NC653_040209 [Populus alba x Populus x berolinensis]|uniref:Uncharacterized protein n=1 Tax=Populus alba x Populus x berolinensis TaxID=444605 RepID=A0AAD6LDA4_9ROSI|nr:hypothetical protein NC653_040209 [Populus alba x Populus x berolinensis]
MTNGLGNSSLDAQLTVVESYST